MVLKPMLGAGASPLAGVRDATEDPGDGRFFATCDEGALGSGDVDAG
jgi:hypothetical protein